MFSSRNPEQQLKNHDGCCGFESFRGGRAVGRDEPRGCGSQPAWARTFRAIARDRPQDPSSQGVDEMTKTTLSRRHLLAGASATAAASFVASARPAAAKAPLLKSQAPAFYRFNA